MKTTLLHALGFPDQIIVDGFEAEWKWSKLKTCGYFSFNPTYDEAVYINNQDIEIEHGKAPFLDNDGVKHWIEFRMVRPMNEKDMGVQDKTGD